MSEVNIEDMVKGFVAVAIVYGPLIGAYFYASESLYGIYDKVSGDFSERLEKRISEWKDGK